MDRETLRKIKADRDELDLSIDRNKRDSCIQEPKRQSANMVQAHNGLCMWLHGNQYL